MSEDKILLKLDNITEHCKLFWVRNVLYISKIWKSVHMLSSWNNAVILNIEGGEGFLIPNLYLIGTF